MRRAAKRSDRARLMRELSSRHPGLREALSADTRVTAQHRGEPHEFRSAVEVALAMLRLMWVSDAFLAQVLYRCKARLQALGVPVLPRLAHRLAMSIAGVSIGDPVLIRPGVYIVHGMVVLDGIVEVGSGTVISPFVTIGLRAGNVTGPILEEGVSVGTGAKLIGPIRVGARAQVGANAVVVSDVEAGTTVVGSPAREVTPSGQSSTGPGD